MATDTNKAILDLSTSIAQLSKQFENGEIPPRNVQDTLVLTAEKLAIAARRPDENVYNIAGQLSHNAALRSAISMDLFDKIPDDGTTISVEKLAAHLNANPESVGRILRACTTTHLFDMPSFNQYCHNALSRVYKSPDQRALSAQIYDYTGHAVLAIPEFGASVDWKSTGDYNRGAFQIGYVTDLTYMEYLQANPQRIKSWNTGMRAGKIGAKTSAFPFDRAIELDPPGEKGIAVVDVGGGRGQALEGIREDFPNMQGRLILQDLPGVIADAEKAGLPSFIETSPGSFFDPLPQGARLYHFRRVFHIWTQEKAKELLENSRKAMDEYSRVIIADMVLPDIGCPRDLAMQDLNMMSLGGMERSETEWKQLIDSAGLVLHKIWQNQEGPKHAVVEAVLPGFKGNKLD